MDDIWANTEGMQRNNPASWYPDGGGALARGDDRLPARVKVADAAAAAAHGDEERAAGGGDVGGRIVSEDRSKRARKAAAGAKQRKGEAKGEAHFESLVADYKKRLLGSDIAEGMKEWM